jgi:hypothetical protein
LHIGKCTNPDNWRWFRFLVDVAQVELKKC